MKRQIKETALCALLIFFATLTALAQQPQPTTTNVDPCNLKAAKPAVRRTTSNTSTPSGPITQEVTVNCAVPPEVPVQAPAPAVVSAPVTSNVDALFALVAGLVVAQTARLNAPPPPPTLDLTPLLEVEKQNHDVLVEQLGVQKSIRNWGIVTAVSSTVSAGANVATAIEVHGVKGAIDRSSNNIVGAVNAKQTPSITMSQVMGSATATSSSNPKTTTTVTASPVVTSNPSATATGGTGNGGAGGIGQGGSGGQGGAGGGGGQGGVGAPAAPAAPVNINNSNINTSGSQSGAQSGSQSGAQSQSGSQSSSNSNANSQSNPPQQQQPPPPPKCQYGTNPDGSCCPPKP